MTFTLAKSLQYYREKFLFLNTCLEDFLHQEFGYSGIYLQPIHNIAVSYFLRWGWNCVFFSVAYVCLIFICSWYAFSLSLCCCSVVDSTHLDLLDLCRKPLRFDVIKVVFYIKMSCENSRYSCYPNILLRILFLKFIFQGFLCMWWCFIIPAVFE